MRERERERARAVSSTSRDLVPPGASLPLDAWDAADARPFFLSFRALALVEASDRKITVKEWAHFLLEMGRFVARKPWVKIYKVC